MRQGEDGDGAANGLPFRGGLFEAGADSGADAVTDFQVGEVKPREHPVVSAADIGIDHGGRAIGKSEAGTTGRQAKIGTRQFDGGVAPAVEGHMRQHGVDQQRAKFGECQFGDRETGHAATLADIAERGN